MSKIKTKKLILQYSYLKLEEEEVRNICTEVENDIREYILNNYPESYSALYEQAIEEQKDSEDEKTKDKEIVKNKDVKKVYHKITKKTHPDIVGNNKHSSIFSDAVKAYKQDNLVWLLEIASSLNIEVVELSAESVELMRKNVSSLEKSILSRKETVAWAWSQSDTDEQKKALAELLINQGARK